MKKITLKKRSASVIAGILALVLIGGTWAYYNSTGSLENKLSTKTPGGEELVEQFTPENDWQVGQTVDKLAGIENKGEVDLIVRVKMNEIWTLADDAATTVTHSSLSDSNFIDGEGQDDEEDGLTNADGSVVTKDVDFTGWTFNATDGYWYYDEVLKAGDDTGNFLKSITLFEDTDMGKKAPIKYYTKATTKPGDDEIGTDADNEWVELTGDMPAGTTFSRSVSSVDKDKPGYAGAEYSLFIVYETYQATEEAITEATTNGDWDPATTPTI